MSHLEKLSVVLFRCFYLILLVDGIVLGLLGFCNFVLPSLPGWLDRRTIDMPPQIMKSVSFHYQQWSNSSLDPFRMSLNINFKVSNFVF